MSNNFAYDIIKFREMWEKASKSLDLRVATKNNIYQESAFKESFDKAKCDNMHDLYFLAQHIDKVFKSQDNNDIVTEQNDSELANIANKLAKSQNPVYPHTHGPDAGPKPDPDFSDGEILRKLKDIKLKIEEIEKEYHAAQVNGDAKDENKLKKELDKARTEVEELSNDLSKHPWKDVS